MIAIVDYGVGNIRSVERALVHVGAEARLTADLDELELHVIAFGARDQCAVVVQLLHQCVMSFLLGAPGGHVLPEVIRRTGLAGPFA